MAEPSVPEPVASLDRSLDKLVRINRVLSDLSFRHTPAWIARALEQVAFVPCNAIKLLARQQLTTRLRGLDPHHPYKYRELVGLIGHARSVLTYHQGDLDHLKACFQHLAQAQARIRPIAAPEGSWLDLNQPTPNRSDRTLVVRLFDVQQLLLDAYNTSHGSPDHPGEVNFGLESALLHRLGRILAETAAFLAHVEALTEQAHAAHQGDPLPARRLQQILAELVATAEWFGAAAASLQRASELVHSHRPKAGRDA